MSTPNTVTTLNGLFKEIYADKIENLIPDGVKLLKLVPYVEAAKEIGRKISYLGVDKYNTLVI